MKKRIALLSLICVCLMNTVPCYASQSAKVSMTGAGGAEYTTLPEAAALQKDVGFMPKTPASLAGGYQFGEGNTTESFDINEKGEAVNKTKGISFKYKKSDNLSVKSVSLSAEPASDQSFSKDSTLIKYGEVNLHYSDSQANSVSWIDGTVFYMLMDIDKAVSKDELVAMAREMIDLDTSAANKK